MTEPKPSYDAGGEARPIDPKTVLTPEWWEWLLRGRDVGPEKAKEFNPDTYVFSDGSTRELIYRAVKSVEQRAERAEARVEALRRASQSGGTGEWQRCPVCDGRGDHMRGFYDGPGPTSSDGTTRVVCRTCRGIAVICRPGVAALAAAPDVRSDAPSDSSPRQGQEDDSSLEHDCLAGTGWAGRMPAEEP